MPRRSRAKLCALIYVETPQVHDGGCRVGTNFYHLNKICPSGLRYSSCFKSIRHSSLLIAIVVWLTRWFCPNSLRNASKITVWPSVLSIVGMPEVSQICSDLQLHSLMLTVRMHQIAQLTIAATCQNKVVITAGTSLLIPLQTGGNSRNYGKDPKRDNE